MDKVRVGIVGAGNIANSHLASYVKLTDAEIVGICDINPERLKITQNVL